MFLFLLKLFDKDCDIFCVMDLYCKYVLGVDENFLGVRFIDLDDLWKFFFDVFICFYENILF